MWNILCHILVRHTHIETNKSENLLMTSLCLCRDEQRGEMQPSWDDEMSDITLRMWRGACSPLPNSLFSFLLLWTLPASPRSCWVFCHWLKHCSNSAVCWAFPASAHLDSICERPGPKQGTPERAGRNNEDDRTKGQPKNPVRMGKSLNRCQHYKPIQKS